MKSKRLFLFALSALVLSSCGEAPASSAAPESSTPQSSEPESSFVSSDSVASSDTQPVSSSEPAPSSSSASSEDISSASSSSSEDEPSDEDVIYTGNLRIWYHQDDMNYSGLAIYLWNNSVDGQEYAWTGEDADYGVYFDINLATSEQFAAYPSTDIRLIVKRAGSWADQSLDTFCYFKDYKIETVGEEQWMNIYLAAGEAHAIETYAKRDDALGDHFDSAYAGTDWKSIYLVGGGTKGQRQESEVGLLQAYKIYGFTTEYYQLRERVREQRKEEFVVKAQILSTPVKNLKVSLEGEIDPSVQYVVEGHFCDALEKTKAKAVSVRNLFDTAKFKSDYVYSGKDLGVTVNGDGTKTFKVWAPTSSLVQVCFYLFGTPWNLRGSSTADLQVKKNMELGEKGVWSLTIKNSYQWYTYIAHNSNGAVEAVDPYAKATGLNGERGAILDWNDEAVVDPANWKGGEAVDEKLPAIASANNLTVYEAHIRDLTADKTWVSNKQNLRGTYNAFVEEGTTYNGVTTGFDHIKEMGVNAIQLLPVFDQDNDERQSTVYTSTEDGGKLNGLSYNWGYNPKNYNVVEGAYSSDPTSATARIHEFKNLIKASADHGIRVIMDVVYNHMSSVANNSFTKLVPYYFFRADASGNYTDGSGCGNEFASERPMASKFIVDSVAWWASEYRIKGFRFDLMGCIDIDTMKAVRAEVNKIDPTIVLYGEGWTGGGSSLPGAQQASTSNIYTKLNTDGAFPIGGFNDCGRDGMKGNTAYGDVVPNSGFMNTENPGTDLVYEALTQVIGENKWQKPDGGCNPNQTVNYMACHDNYTLYDQMNYQLFGVSNCAEDHDFVVEGVVAAQSFSLFSQGLGFINGGDELFRTKLIRSDDELFEELVASYKHGSYDHGDGHVDHWIEGDGIEINKDTWLVRNSYKYGDAVNSFKWDRKIKYAAQCQKIADMVKLRAQEMGNSLGKSLAEVNAQKAYCWSYEDLIEDGHVKTGIIGGGAYGEKTKKNYYVFLGGYKIEDRKSIGIGAGTYIVKYSSNGYHTVGDTITVPNKGAGAYLLNVKEYETLVICEA